MDKTALTELAAQELAAARDATRGRSARTLFGGRDRTLRQTMIALAAGYRLDEHENPGEATLQVLHGRVRLNTAEQSAEAVAGELLVIPEARHDLEALDDSVVLLTVAKLA